MGLPNSPSLGMSMPTSFCARTTSPMAERSRVCSAASSSVVTAFFAHMARKSAGRGRLPTWVVRMRSVLRFMAESVQDVQSFDKLRMSGKQSVHGERAEPRSVQIVQDVRRLKGTAFEFSNPVESFGIVGKNFPFDLWIEALHRFEPGNRVELARGIAMAVVGTGNQIFLAPVRDHIRKVVIGLG